MKKTVIRFLILFLLGLSGYFTYRNLDTYLEWDHPLNTKVEFKYVYVAVTDQDNNVYCIDQGKKRITKSNPEGMVIYVIKAGKSPEGLDCVFSDLAAGDGGNLYAKKITVTRDGFYAFREEIVQYAPKSRGQGRTIYRMEYPDPGAQPPAHPGLLRSFTYSGGFLYFFKFSQYANYRGDDDKVILQKLSVANPALKYPEVPFTFSKEFGLNKVIGVNPAAVYCTTKYGEIFQLDPSDKQHHQKIYPVAAGNTNWLGGANHILNPGKSSQLSINQGSPVHEFRTNPVYLGLDSRRRLYFTDESERRICRLDPQQKFDCETVLSEAEWQVKTGSSEPMLIKDMTIREDGTIATLICDRIFIKQADGAGTTREVTTAQYGNDLLWQRCIIWLWPVFFIVLLIYTGSAIYRIWIRKRIFAKQMLVFILVIMLSMAATSYIVFQNYSETLTKHAIERLSAIVDIGTRMLRYQDLEQITTPGDYNRERHNALHQYLNLIQGTDPQISSNEMYSTIYKLEKFQGHNIFYICVTHDNYRSPFYPYYLPDRTDRIKYDNAVDDNDLPYQTITANYLQNSNDIISFNSSKDVEGDWIFVIRRIIDQQTNQVIGLYEIGMMRDQIIMAENQVLRLIIEVNFLIFLVSSLIIWFVIQQLLTPLGKLTHGVSEVAAGNLDLSVAIHSGDEMEKLGDGFNIMSANLKDRVQKIEAMRNSYARFVPKQFGEFLQVSDMTDIQLGAQANCEMGIMFSSIRSFYEQLKKQNMTPKESFQFINDFLKRIGPVIPAHGGFISDYLGAGIIALFPQQNDDALKAALKMRQQLEQYNQFRIQFNQPPVDIGIAIHRCPMILGIAGEENRLEGTVISEGVALTETLEQATAKFGAAILITESIIQTLSNRNDYQYRYVGLISLAGDNEPTPVYDLYQGDIESIRSSKHDTREEFETGVKLYQQQHFQKAKMRFINVIKRNNHDEAAKIYFYLCDEFIQKEIPPNWNGSVE